jgi:hypothetical protein
VAIDVRAGAPAGRSHHIALQADGNIQVFDVWESQEAFEAFGATLIPILTGLGVDPGEPMVAPVHNVIQDPGLIPVSITFRGMDERPDSYMRQQSGFVPRRRALPRESRARAGASY